MSEARLQQDFYTHGFPCSGYRGPEKSCTLALSVNYPVSPQNVDEETKGRNSNTWPAQHDLWQSLELTTSYLSPILITPACPIWAS